MIWTQFMEVHLTIKTCLYIYIYLFQFDCLIKTHELSSWSLWLQDLFHATQLKSNRQNCSFTPMMWYGDGMQWDACEVQWDVRLNESCKVRCLHPLTVYNALHGLSLASSIICSIINNISSQLQNFHMVEIFHIRRECNKLAH